MIKHALSRFLLILSCLSSFAAQGQQDQGGDIHWAYASFFGTGQYKVGSEQTAYVFRPDPRWTLQEAELLEDGGRQFGWRFSLPVALGWHDYDMSDSWEFFEPGNLGSVSVTPTVEATVPVNERWELRPHVSLGWGSLTDGDESAWIYSSGVKSRLAFAWGRLDWSLESSLGVVGYTPDQGSEQHLYPLMAGLEFGYPLDRFKLQDGPMQLYWHVRHTTYVNDLNFRVQRQTIASEKNAWELGFAVGKQGSALQFWEFTVDRIGLSFYRASGDVHGFTINVRSVFE
jgi:hypothetical protein